MADKPESTTHMNSEPSTWTRKVAEELNRLPKPAHVGSEAWNAVSEAINTLGEALSPISVFHQRFQQDKYQIEHGKDAGFDIHPSRTLFLDQIKNGSSFKPGEDLKVEFRDPANNKDQGRYFYLHIPKNYDPSKKMPLALMFNGLAPRGQIEFPSFSGMQAASDKYGIITAYLEAIGPQHTFNNGQWPFNATGADDMGLVGRMLDTLPAKLPVDTKRIYIGGFSTGGSFGREAAIKYSTKIAADADLAGWLWGDEQMPSTPFSSMTLYGKRDPVILEGGTPGMKAAEQKYSKVYKKMPGVAALNELQANEQSGGPFVNQPILSALHAGMLLGMKQPPWQSSKFFIEPKQFTIDYMRRADGITNAQPDKIDKTLDRTIKEWYSKTNGTEVMEVIVPENEHAWPGSKDHRHDTPLVGTPVMSVDATELMVQFWLRHSTDDKKSVAPQANSQKPTTDRIQSKLDLLLHTGVLDPIVPKSQLTAKH